MLPFHLVILGPQGSGKGTQAELLSKKFKMPYLGAGELIRKKTKEKTEEGKKVKALHDAGILIPDQLVKKLFDQELKKISKNRTIIFEGYPRTKKQLEDFEEILKKRQKEKRIIILEVKEKTIYKRLVGRRFCPSCEKNFYPPKSLTLKECLECKVKLKKRPDDNPKTIKERLNVYKKETKPLISYFERRGELIRIDGEPEIEKVNKEIIGKLKGII